MSANLYHLYWKDQFIGTITNVGWLDFPWAGGHLSFAEISNEVRECIEYIYAETATDDGLQDWPFPKELFENWHLVKPDGNEVEISPPIVDFSDGYVTWR